MPLIIIGICLFVAMVFIPQWWVKRVLSENQIEREELGGTGSELARELLDRADLRHVKVELTESGDHYDPSVEVVRLSLPHHDGKSVAALSVAAHEVSHALQHAEGNRLFEARQRLAPSVIWFERLAQVMLFTIPLLGVYARSPLLVAGQAAIVVLLMGGRLAVHLFTLPVEWDASFRRALPILRAGAFLPEEAMPDARRVLKAAALTYVSAGLISLVDITRLIRILR